MMLQHCKLYQSSIGIKLTKKNDKEKVEKLMKENKNYALSQFYKGISHDKNCHDLYPGYMYLLKLSLIFPHSVACVEHLLSKIKQDSFKKLAR